MPADRERIGFEPVTAGHYALLAHWLEQPHMRQWWGDPEEELAQIRDMVEGRDRTRPFLILFDAAPVGYIQYWHIGDWQLPAWLESHPWLAELPADAIGVDLSIGDPALLSRGIGSAALHLFATRLREKGHKTIIIDPDPANLRAVRAYEKAGFRVIESLRGHAELLMRFEPNQEEKLS
jgi:RimJ/RimL family protein N-acetyltransferase